MEDAKSLRAVARGRVATRCLVEFRIKLNKTRHSQCVKFKTYIGWICNVRNVSKGIASCEGFDKLQIVSVIDLLMRYCHKMLKKLIEIVFFSSQKRFLF